MAQRAAAGGQALSPWWRHGTILVMGFGFAVLTLVTVLTYSNAPPIPARVVDSQGTQLFTRADIEGGQEVFLQHALMEHGTLWGHGAYLGPDYTAEYLHREVGIARDALARARFGKPFAALPSAEQAPIADTVRAELKANRYDPSTDTLTFSTGEAAASRALERYWADYFSRENTAPGLPPRSIVQPGEIRLLNAYFAWATWATVTNRPGETYTYTNNWPYDPDAGNHPSTQAYVWSALSLVVLLVGLGVTEHRFDPVTEHIVRHASSTARAAGPGGAVRSSGPLPVGLPRAAQRSCTRAGGDEATRPPGSRASTLHTSVVPDGRCCSAASGTMYSGRLRSRAESTGVKSAVVMVSP